MTLLDTLSNLSSKSGAVQWVAENPVDFIYRIGLSLRACLEAAIKLHIQSSQIDEMDTLESVLVMILNLT
jgi:hypothetical protein